MNKARLLAVALVTFASVPLMMAQQVNATAEQNASATARNAHVDESANATASANTGHADMNGAVEGSMNASGGRADATAYSEGAASAELRPVKGELENRLDSKTAKPGDKVILKTSEKMRTSDGTEIPKGSRLVGHVTEVQAHQKGHAESHLGLEFDRADLKGGQSMAIHSMIESIQPNASAVAAGTMDNEEAFATPMGGGGGSMGGGAIGGGRVGGTGLLGGNAGGAAAATGSLGSNLGSTAGGAMHAARRCKWGGRWQPGAWREWSGRWHCRSRCPCDRDSGCDVERQSGRIGIGHVVGGKREHSSGFRNADGAGSCGGALGGRNQQRSTRSRDSDGAGLHRCLIFGHSITKVWVLSNLVSFMGLR